jgi:hypothetical protein
LGWILVYDLPVDTSSLPYGNTHIRKYRGSLKQLWASIWDLDYDALVSFFSILASTFASKHLVHTSLALHKTLEKDLRPLADLCRWYNTKGIR